MEASKPTGSRHELLEQGGSAKQSGGSGSPLMAQLTALKILAIVSTVSAICVMVTSDQNVVVYQIPFSARYSYASAFKFLVGANGLVCGFSVLSLISIWVKARNKSSASQPPAVNLFYLLLHDLVMMGLMIAGCGAATAIGTVAYNGIDEIGWAAICDNVNNFCHQILASVALSYLAFFSYLALTILSATKLASHR
ncbi:CASP-like protein 1F2 [Linum perenne]